MAPADHRSLQFKARQSGPPKSVWRVWFVGFAATAHRLAFFFKETMGPCRLFVKASGFGKQNDKLV